MGIWSVGAGVAVAVVAVVAVVAFLVATTREHARAGVELPDRPGHLSGPYSVVVGDPDAQTTIRIYEDLQCPFCSRLEAVTGARTREAIAAGRVKVDYRPVANLDRLSTTAYSSRALNAAMAVLTTAGPEEFMGFRAIAYARQPPEGGAGVPDATLVDWAVQAGADRDEVTPLVQGNAFHEWAVNATRQMHHDGVTLTPTILIDGRYQGEDSSVAARNMLAAMG